MGSLRFVLFGGYPGIAWKHLWASFRAIVTMLCEVPWRFSRWRIKVRCCECGREFRRDVEAGSQFWTESSAPGVVIGKCAKCVGRKLK